MQQSAPPQVQDASPRPQPSHTVDRHPQRSSHFQSAARGTTLDRYIGDARRERPPEVQLWKCGCGFHNKQSGLVCRNCRAPKGGKADKTDDPSIAENWKHVKRIGDSSKQQLEPADQIKRPTEPVVDRRLEEERQKRLADSQRLRFVKLDSHIRKTPLDFQDVSTQPVPEFKPRNRPSVDESRTRVRQHEGGRKDKQSNEPEKGMQPAPLTEYLPPNRSAKPLDKQTLPRNGSAKLLDDAPVAARGKPEPTAPILSEKRSRWKKWDSSHSRSIPEPSQSALFETSGSQGPIERNGQKFNVAQGKKDDRVWSRMSYQPEDGRVSDGYKSMLDVIASQEPIEGNEQRFKVVRGGSVIMDRKVQRSTPKQSEDDHVSDEHKSVQPRSTVNGLARAALPRNDESERRDPSEESFVADGYELMQSRAKSDRSTTTAATQYDQPEREDDVLSSSNGPSKKGWKSWGPSQTESNQPMQPCSMPPNRSIERASFEEDRSGRGNIVPSRGKSADAGVWKVWRPVQHTKADFANLFSDDELNNFESASTPDDGYVSVEEHAQGPPAHEPPLYVSSEEMKVSASQAVENRMARRRQQIEEEYRAERKKSASTYRHDPDREKRTSMLRTRSFIESEAGIEDYDEDSDHIRQQRKKQRKQQLAAEKLQGPPTPIYLPDFISVTNLAGALRISIEKFTTKMKELGFDETNNDHVIDAETAGLIAAEFNFEPIIEGADDSDLIPRPPAEDKSLLPPRPPVVTIMGHVDHGKTTLLDWLRKSSVAASEYGGITQHIGAFSVPMPSGRTITFLDTPGHAAFLEMRQRGASVTDIVILVVAADDSVKPQTVEAIKHARAANVPMIVAVNKIDKEEADVDKVKQDLARYGVEIEDYGGDTQVVCVSGRTGQGMETLEESAVALADILDMRAETDGPAEGWVLEATTKKAGRVATVLVRRGTLYPGDILVAGTTWTRIRTLRNEAGVQVESASPGMPVEIDGWKDQPAAGEEALQADDEQHARSVVDVRLQVEERAQMATDVSAVNETRKQDQERRKLTEAADAEAAEVTPKENKDETPGFKDVPLVVKADVSGSVEAIQTSLLALGNNFVRASILRSGVGTVSEFDVVHAASARGHIVAFNIAIEPHIRRAAETSGVKILEQNVIYRLVDLVKDVLEDCLEPVRTKRVLGEAEVAQVFDINVKGRKFVPVAGCKVRNGVVGRRTRILVKRGEEVVFDGKSVCVSPLLFYFLFCYTRT